MPAYQLKNQQNKMIGQHGDVIQLGKGKYVPVSESLHSEEMKYANAVELPDECTSTKAGLSPIERHAARANKLTVLPDNAKISAPQFQRSFISVSCVKEEVNPDPLVVGHSTVVDKHLGQGQENKNHDVKIITPANSSESELAVNEESDRSLKHIASNSTSLLYNETKLHSFLEEDSRKKSSNILNVNSVHTQNHREYFVAENDMEDFQRFMSRCHYLRIVPKSESKTNSDDLDAVTSRPANESSSSSLPGLKEPMLAKNSEGACLEACLDNFKSPCAEEHAHDDMLNTGKCKGTEIKQEHESQESAEGSDNVQSASTGKRRCSFTAGMRSSKVQKLSGAETASCSESSLKRGSSFMKWISNLMKGLSEFNLDRKFLSEKSQRPLNDEHVNLDSLCMLEEPDQNAYMCRNRSFQNFFHDMYRANLRLHDEKVEGLECDMGTNESLSVGEASKRPFGEGCSYAASAKNTELLYETNTYKPEERSCAGSGAIPPWSLSLPCSNTMAVAKDKQKINLEGNGCSYEIACGFEKWSISLPKVSSTKGFGSSANITEKPMPDNVDGGKASDVTKNKVMDTNLWIARFSRSHSAHLSKPLQENKGVHSANEALANVDGGVSSTQNGVDAVMNPKVIEASQPSSKRCLDGCVSSMDMHDSGRNENLQLEKLPIVLPPQRSVKVSDSPASEQELPNNLEMFSCRRGKGLDIPKQMTTASVTRGEATLVCFFCGSVGHSIRKCPEIVKYPLANTIACDNEEESSYFCICCFHLDHWAISCPLLSSSIDCMGLVRLKRGCEKVGALPDHDGKRKTQPEAVDNGYWFNKHKTKVANHDQAAVGNTMLGSSQSASSSGCLESKANQTIPFFGPHSGKIPAVPHGMFERIKRLQLTRSDIVRWMRVPRLNLHLEGFFLRVRFRKWEERLGGGYCVACISGIYQDRAHNLNNIQLLVNLGGFNCLVDYRYISNHEFAEEEITEWWSSALNGDFKVPSEEDLRLKIEEKKKLNVSRPEHFS